MIKVSTTEYNNNTNKFGANQYQLDPRQGLFKKYYLDIESDTYGNKLQSLIKAGYSEKTAKVLTKNTTVWLREIFREINESKLIELSQKVLEKTLEERETDLDHKRMALDAAKHITKIGKSIGNVNIDNRNITINNKTITNNFSDKEKELFDEFGKKILELERGKVIDIE